MAATAYGPGSSPRLKGSGRQFLPWGAVHTAVLEGFSRLHPGTPVTAPGPGNRPCTHGCGLTWFPNPGPHRASSSCQGPHKVTPRAKSHRTQGSHSRGSSPAFMTVLPARSSHQASVYHKVVAWKPSWHSHLIGFPGEISQKVNPRSTLSVWEKRGLYSLLPTAPKMRSSGVATLRWRCCRNTPGAMPPGPELRGEV